MSQPSVDPVAAPAQYQRMLLSLLGPDDPAAVQASTPAALRAMVARAGSDLRRRPAEGEWSVLELAGHLADAELVVGTRYRWALAHHRPPLLGYDQDLWVARLGHNDDDPEELLALFEALRRANLALWRRMPVTDRARAAIHAERGPESVDLMFRMLAGHDRFHLAQMERTLGAVRSRLA